MPGPRGTSLGSDFSSPTTRDKLGRRVASAAPAPRHPPALPGEPQHRSGPAGCSGPAAPHFQPPPPAALRPPRDSLTGDLGLGHTAKAEALGPIQLPDLGAAPRLAAAVTASRGGDDTQQPKSPREETHPSPLAPPPAVRRAKPRSRGVEAAGVPGAARCGAGRRGVRGAAPSLPAGSPGGTTRSGRGRQRGQPGSQALPLPAACGEGAGEFNPDAAAARRRGAEIQVWPGRAALKPQSVTAHRAFVLSAAASPGSPAAMLPAAAAPPGRAERGGVGGGAAPAAWLV